MGWVWSPIALLGLPAAAVAYALAVAIYMLGRKGRRELFLVGLLLANGTQALAGAGLMYLMTRPEDAFALQFLTTLSGFASQAFLLLLAGTFPSPLARPFRGPVGIAVTTLAAAGLMTWALVDSSLIVRGVVPASYAPWEGVGTPLTSRWFLFVIPLTTVYLLAVGIDAARREQPGTVGHAHGRVLARAFAVRCAGIVVGYPTLVLTTSDAGTIIALAFIVAGVLGMMLVLAHGILRTQLFDVDLRIKWGVRRGTVAAAFVGVFFVVSEGAQTVLSTRLGPILGLLAAGALVFALAPLQRFADGLADRAMPRVQDTAEYRTVRKREVYRAAVESALEDGDVTDKERAMLATLQDQLGVGAKEAHDIERDARAARARVA